MNVVVGNLWRVEAICEDAGCMVMASIIKTNNIVIKCHKFI